MRVFRITCNNQYTEAEFDYFVLQNPEFVMVMEYKIYAPPQGAHWHGFTHEEISSQAVATRIKNFLHCVGNADYSISAKELNAAEPEGYQRYISKGAGKSTPPSQFRNVSQEQVEVWHAQYWHENEQVKKQVKAGREGQKDKLFEYCQNQLGSKTDPDDLIHTILAFFVKEDKIVSNSQVENYYYYISCKMDRSMLTRRATSIANQIRQKG